MLATHCKGSVEVFARDSNTPVLMQQQLARQQRGNELRIEKIANRLEFKRHGIKLQDKFETIKCLYPTKYSRLRLRDGRSYANNQLETIGRQLLLLTFDDAFLNLFKKSQQDISGLDFNYEAKMEHMSSWRKNPISFTRRFLKWNDLTELARLPAPQSRVPSRVQCAFDRRSFDAIIGYISVTNDPDAVSRFLKARVARQIAQKIMLR